MSRLRGNLDFARLDRIAGWALDQDSPGKPAVLRVLDNGLVVGRISPDLFREDLLTFGGDGKHGFSFAFPNGLSPDIRHVISVQWEKDRSELPGSPWTIEAHRAFEIAEPPGGAETLPPLRGFLEAADRNHVEGWAWDAEKPDQPVTLRVVVNGAVVTRGLANRHRPDLETANIGDGRHAFQIRIPGGLSPLSRQVIRVLSDSDGREIEDSPRVIEAATRFDGALEQAVENAVASLEEPEEQARVLGFLTTLADRLLQRNADTRSQSAEREAYRRFRRRWGPAAEDTSLADPGLRALVIDDEAPDPARDAGSQAILSHIGSLQRLGYRVSFVGAHDVNDPSVETTALTAAGIDCWRAPFYVSVEEVLRRQAHCFDLIYLHRISNASKYMALGRHYHPRARILYGVASLSHLRLAAQAKIEERPELLAESRRARLAECTAAWSADAVIAHSSEEAAWLRQAVPEAHVYQAPWSVPARPTTAPFATRQGIAFIGSYSSQPNVDAAIFLAEEIMPIVWRRDTRIDCLLVGSRMPQSIKALARPRLIAIGHVTELTDIFDRVRLTVAPLRYGAGVKGKVVNSFAAGIPCIMTPVAAEGIDLPAVLEGVVGADAEEFADRILRFHKDEALCREAAAAGLALIGKHFSDAEVDAALKSAIDGSRRPT
jgi:glycosyltransferase involved in cell wall biosynthesis